MKRYKPAKGNGFAWGVGLMLFCAVIAALPMVISARPGGPGLIFNATMGIILILVLGVIGYFTWSAKNLEYRIENDKLVIRWAFNQKEIPFASIKGVQKTIGSSSIKVAGASWPGFHWGTFADPRGKGSINLYATRLLGDIIVINTRWERMGITPENPDEFLEELNRLLPEFHQNGDLVEGEEEAVRFSPLRSKLFVGMISLSLLIMAGTAIFLAKEIPGLPERVPMHINLAGEVDRYGSPNEIWAPFGIGLAIEALLLGISLVAVRNNKISAYMMGVTGILVSLIFCVIAISMVISF